MDRRSALSLLLGGFVAPRAFGRDDFTIRTTSRLVLLDVSVKNTKGGFASGLSKAQFRV